MLNGDMGRDSESAASDGKLLFPVEKRNDYFDVVKFFILFCMLFGHAIQYCSYEYDFFANPVFKAIYGCHMPLFALISGWFFFYSANKYTYEQILKTKCLSMVRSIVVGNFLYWVVFVVVELIRTKDVSVFVNGGWINQLFGLWFLWATMLSMVIVGFAYKKIKNGWLSLLCMILGTAVFFVFPNSVACIFVYPFFLIGFFACKHKDILKKIAPLRFLSIPLYPLLIGFYKNDYYIYVSGLWGGDYTPLQSLGIDAYRFVTGIVGCVFILTILRPVYNLISESKCCEIITKTGQKSLQVYVLQTIAFYLVSVVVRDCLAKTNYVGFMNRHFGLYTFAVTLAFAVLLMAILNAVIELLYRLKIGKFVFGR